MKHVKMIKTVDGRDDNSNVVTTFIAGEVYLIGEDLHRAFLEQGFIENFEPEENQSIEPEETKTKKRKK